MKLYTAEQIKAWDQFTIANQPVTSVDLMERAAQKCTDFLARQYKGNTFKIFCGKGNNGGDGLAIARQLKRHTSNVEVYIVELGKPGTNDFQHNLQRLHKINTHIHYIQNPEMFPEILPGDIIIDCLFGSGVNRPLHGLWAELVLYLNASANKIVAIDVPSGLYINQTSVGNPCINATFTLTFQRLKLALLIPENVPCIGKPIVLNIGLHKQFKPDEPVTTRLVSKKTIRKIYTSRKPFSHKGTYGHALVFAGSKGKMGACLLSSKACLRAGAGLISVLVPEWGLPIVQTAFPEAMAQSTDNFTTIDFLVYQAIGVGPGLGTADTVAPLFRQVLTATHLPMVIDADGLNLLAKNADWMSLIPKNSILTPHPREFERLFGKPANDFERLDLARGAAKKWQVVVVLKGYYTCIALPNGKLYFNTTGNAGMATAGSGDVLTGILTALLAQKYHPHKAAILGVYLHGLAGDLAAKYTSKEALIAGDLIDYLGDAFLQIAKD